MQENNVKYHYITSFVFEHKLIKEKLNALSFDMYYTFIKIVELNIIINPKFVDPKSFML